MTTLVGLLLIVAVVLAAMRAFQVGIRRVDLGWLAIACVIAAVWAVPALS